MPDRLADFLRGPLAAVFEWKAGKYLRHLNGAAKRIIETTFPQKGKIKLYRGTSEKYSSGAALLKTPAENFSAFGAVPSIFTTPDRMGALTFAKPRLVRFELERDALIELVDVSAETPLAYAGIEGIISGDFRSSFMERGYVEIALFVDPKGTNDQLLKSVI